MWNGEALNAKAIGKVALRESGYDLQGWHTDPIIDLLERLGFPIWDVKENGEIHTNGTIITNDDALVFELTKRLARKGHKAFRDGAMKL